MTNLTKHAMAEALKKLLNGRTLESITIQDVADEADVSRKTFYYHFHDIFDLVEWMLVEECRSLTAENADRQHWMQAVAAGLSFARENRRWLTNIYQSMDRAQLERILRKIIGPQVEQSFDRAVGGRTVDEADRRFVLDIFTYGVAGLFLSWVGDGMQGDADFLQDKLLGFFTDSLQLVAERCVTGYEKK